MRTILTLRKNKEGLNDDPQLFQLERNKKLERGKQAAFMSDYDCFTRNRGQRRGKEGKTRRGGGARFYTAVVVSRRV